MLRRYLCETVRLVGQDRPYRRSPSVKPASGDQGTASVATRPGENHHGFSLGITVEEPITRQCREGPPGVLHHLDEVDPVILNHGLIHGGHLHAGDGRYELMGISGILFIQRASGRSKGPTQPGAPREEHPRSLPHMQRN